MSKETVTTGWEQPKNNKEKTKLSETELHKKNLKEFKDLVKFIWTHGKFSYKDKKWQFIQVVSSINVRGIDGEQSYYTIVINKSAKPHTNKPWSRPTFGTSIRFYYDKQKDEFFAGAKFNEKNSKDIHQDLSLPLSPSEAWEYLKAIRDRVNDYKKTVKETFIELSDNQDHQDADNLIETIDTQTA